MTKKRQSDRWIKPRASRSSFVFGALPVNRTAFEIIHESRADEQPAREILKEKPLGNDLLSQEVALQVPSALTDLTAGFGM